MIPLTKRIPSLLRDTKISQTIIVDRPAGTGSYNDDGVFVGETYMTITDKGVVTPSSMDDLLALPEGQRTEKSITLYWPQLFLVDDRVEYGGDEYRVVQAGTWQPYSYCKAIAQVNQTGQTVG